MLIRKLNACDEFVAGDGTLLRELLHPDKQPLALQYSLAHAIVPAGQTSYPHSLKTSEVYYILSGTGEMHIDDESQRVEPGDTIYIPPDAEQFVYNSGTEPLVFICIVDPAWRPEDETVYGDRSPS
ncbi:cupin domain-containing protein [Leptolyngbya sp. FACHB-671]|uniref:cupin domain-containing protein n=1 Tax=Leptolyngbya sp. FACHB-671 TaxID=2692812 RepID=UPI00168A2175|nr:cupin domain-containing protein [Leptolyngbya sp. FACHB-671]MBD2069981.1 cupin domain-containing protein [Leptolyngbya sp. FACHB-671]